MRLRFLCVLLVLAGISGCGNQATTTTPSTPTVVKHTYNGTASVGDFLTITLNTTALTMTYNDLTNGLSGTFPYTVNANGSYALNDPNGHLISAYEIPGYALLIQAKNVGPKSDTSALITAVESGPISMSTFANKNYNYIQFRTSAGGLEVGSVKIGANSGQNSSFWPYGNISNDPEGAFHNGTLDFSAIHADASGTFLSQADGNGGTDYIFGTSGGFFMVDMSNGSLIGLPKAATAAFDPTVAGTYSGIFYTKANAATGAGNVETGTPSTDQATIVITAAANITVTDSQGNTFINATLTPVANSSYLYDGSAGKLADPCNGLFSFRAVTGTYEHDVFVTFVGNSVVFAKFSATLPSTPSSSYDYWYGVGLK